MSGPGQQLRIQMLILRYHLGLREGGDEGFDGRGPDGNLADLNGVQRRSKPSTHFLSSSQTHRSGFAASSTS